MHNLLADQLDDALRPTPHATGLACEPQLRAAAGTLSQARTGEISATTVLGVLGADDLLQFQALIADIAQTSNLDVDVQYQVGTFQVRFTRGASPLPESAAADTGLGAWLRGLRRRVPAAG